MSQWNSINFKQLHLVAHGSGEMVDGYSEDMEDSDLFGKVPGLRSVENKLPPEQNKGIYSLMVSTSRTTAAFHGEKAILASQTSSHSPYRQGTTHVTSSPGFLCSSSTLDHPRQHLNEKLTVVAGEKSCYFQSHKS